YESETFLTDSILWGNTGTLGNQIALGSDDEPVYIDRPATLTVSHCDIQDGNSPQSIYYEPGRILNWLGGNIDTDPLFVGQYYYLSQTAAGQAVDSPCVDAGSDLATALGLGSYTTRSDGVNDVNVVDIGIHYPAAEGQYQLTVNVIGTHGTIQPNSGFFNKFTVVTLTATVDPGYRIKWIGTDDDTVYTLTNTVTMYSDRTVTAIIEQPAIITVPGDYPIIQEAIEAAEDGDLIVLNRGRYVGTPQIQTGIGGTLVIIDKAITITSTNPDDPCTVADTIIDCNGYATYGIVLSRVGPDTVINGLTIANNTWTVLSRLDPSDPGDDGYIGGDHGGAGILIDAGASPTILNCIIRDCRTTAGDASSGNTGDTGNPGGRGGDGGDAYGGGIYCGYRSSPTIRNCTISNVRVIGGDAGNGGNGGDNSGDDSVAGNGGNGGNGGAAYGGGIFVDFESRPLITDCTIINCSATGGIAGDAGDGGNTSGSLSYGGDGGNGGYNGRAYGGGIHFADRVIGMVYNCQIINCSATAGGAGNGGDYGDGDLVGSAGYGGGYLGEYWKESAYGGGVYSGTNSIITFEECTFSNNTITGGMSGIGGDPWAGQRPPPVYSYLIPVYGAGVFCDSYSRTAFEGCHVAGNSADDVYDPTDPNELVNRMNPYVSFGGGIGFIDVNSATITDSNLNNNYATVGGGLYWDEADDFVVTNSNFTNNTAFKGGGIYGVDSASATITGCIITGNQAVYPGGEGGGVYFSSLPTLIADSEIRFNYSDYSGGGLYMSGGASETKILKNCLITNNSARRDGGGISASWHNELTISNCTIHNNIAYDFNDPVNSGYGGGLFCGYGSYTDIIDSILWNNFGSKGSEISVSTGFEFDPRPSTVAVSYSDIDGWQNPFDPNLINPAVIFVDTSCALNWDFNSVIDAYPFFVNGYFLSQTAAGQFINSPCVDTGSGDANDPNIGMYPDKYTTRTDYFGDVNTVDMGYHLPKPFHLVVSVVDANGMVITDPNLALGYVVPSDMYYPRGMVVQIAAFPDPNYQVKEWTGTDDDTSTDPNNTVTMNGDKYVTVEFEVAPVYQLTTMVIGDHGTLEVQPTGGFYTNRTVVTLIATPDPTYRVKAWTGTDDDLSYALTNTVTMNSNKTVIVEFEPDITRNLLVPFEYATIEEAVAAAYPARDIIIAAPITHYVSGPNGIDFQGKSIILMSENPDDPNTVASTIIECAASRYYPGRAFHFHNGEDANTIVTGFTIRGGFMTGPLGLPGSSYTLTPIPYEPMTTDDPPPPRGERGGDATGDGYGGAILCENASSPTIVNCVITGNVVTGAYGGDGADGDYGPFSFI
ncbi:MAG: InlB B-repeat-containing protein, partial [Planctomycetota bacterium]